MRTSRLIVLALLLSLLPAHGWAATAFVQSINARDLTAANTVAAAFGSNVTAGNVIGCFVWWLSNAVTLDTVTDTLGNVYTRVNNPTTVGCCRAAGAYAANIAGGANTVTATFSANPGSDKRLVCHEVSGASTTAPLDGSTLQGQASPGTGTDAITSGTIVTTVNGDYIFGATVPVGAPGQTPGTGFTQRVNSTTRESEDQIQSTAGSIAATFTAGGAGTDTWFTFIAAFAPVVTPPPVPTSGRPCCYSGRPRR